MEEVSNDEEQQIIQVLMAQVINHMDHQQCKVLTKEQDDRAKMALVTL